MKINFNGKQTIIVAASALAMGGVIFLGDYTYHKIRNRKKTEEPVEEKAENEETEK